MFLKVTALQCIDIDNAKDFGLKIRKNAKPSVFKEAVFAHLDTYRKEVDPSIDQNSIEWIEDDATLYFRISVYYPISPGIKEIDIEALMEIDAEPDFISEIDCYESWKIVMEKPEAIVAKGELIMGVNENDDDDEENSITEKKLKVILRRFES